MKKPRRTICVLLSEPQYTQLTTEHLTTGTSLPELLRQAYFSKEPSKFLMTQTESQRFLNELRKQGGRLNQIASHLNRGTSYDWEKEFSEICDHYRMIRNLISVIHGNN